MTNVLVLNFGFSLCVTFLFCIDMEIIILKNLSKPRVMIKIEMNMVLLLIVSMFQVQTPVLQVKWLCHVVWLCYVKEYYIPWASVPESGITFVSEFVLY